MRSIFLTAPVLALAMMLGGCTEATSGTHAMAVSDVAPVVRTYDAHNVSNATLVAERHADVREAAASVTATHADHRAVRRERHVDRTRDAHRRK